MVPAGCEQQASSAGSSDLCTQKYGCDEGDERLGDEIGWWRAWAPPFLPGLEVGGRVAALPLAVDPAIAFTDRYAT